MSDAERTLKEVQDFLEELANDKRLDGLKTVMGWPIQRQAADYARAVGRAIDDVGHYRRAAKQ